MALTTLLRSLRYSLIVAISENDFLQIENQSEEKLDNVREPALKVAHDLLKQESA